MGAAAPAARRLAQWSARTILLHERKQLLCRRRQACGQLLCRRRQECWPCLWRLHLEGCGALIMSDTILGNPRSKVLPRGGYGDFETLNAQVIIEYVWDYLTQMYGIT